MLATIIAEVGEWNRSTTKPAMGGPDRAAMPLTRVSRPKACASKSTPKRFTRAAGTADIHMPVNAPKRIASTSNRREFVVIEKRRRQGADAKTTIEMRTRGERQG